jgi:hypothetical protein
MVFPLVTLAETQLPFAVGQSDDVENRYFFMVLRLQSPLGFLPIYIRATGVTFGSTRLARLVFSRKYGNFR